MIVGEKVVGEKVVVGAVRRSSPGVNCPSLQKNKYCIASKAAATNYHLPTFKNPPTISPPIPHHPSLRSLPVLLPAPSVLPACL